MKYVLSIIGFAFLSYITYASMTNANQTLLQQTIEHNNTVYQECFGIQDRGTGSDTERYRMSTDCWKSKRSITPDDLFLTVPKFLVDEGKCSISQGEDDHVRAERGGMYATDLACKFEGQGVYAPDYLDEMKEYTIESIGSDSLLGNFVILSFKDMDMGPSTRWYFGHTVLDKGWKVGDTVTTGVRFARADLSGATTGWHTHIELRRMYDGVWQSVRYVTRMKERKLDEKRMGGNQGGIPQVSASTYVSPTSNPNQSGGVQKSLVYYFTHYDLGDFKQNDSTPCIGADGKDSCLAQKHGRGTMALTVDIRKRLSIKFGDKVALTGDVGCEGVYTVTDEMACRFRGEHAWSNGPCSYSDGTPTPKNSNVKRPGTPHFIKGDIPGRPGGACSISKL